MNDLFKEFAPVSRQQWREQIERDLKGEPLSSLDWQNENGFTIHPFYTAEDLKHPYEPAFSHTGWRIAADPGNGTRAGNARLLNQLRLGADAFWCAYHPLETPGLLRDVELSFVAPSFSCSAADVKGVADLVIGRSKESPPVTVFPNPSETPDALRAWCAGASAHKEWRWMSVPASRWAHGGALPAYEAALAFAFMSELADGAGSVKPKAVTIRTAVDSDFFVQIAKLRAYRRLWEVIRPAFGFDCPLYLQCETALINKSARDTHNNLLRTSVESAAAILGGCDELLVRPFDQFSDEPCVLALRMAVNQHHILREESGFDKVADVGCGSYYIETLTDQLAESALDQLKQIESDGGYFRISESGKISEQLSAQAAARRQRIGRVEEVLVGINKFRVDHAPGAPLSDKKLTDLQKAGLAPLAAEYESSKELRNA